MKSPSHKSAQDSPSKPHRSKSREVSSRFLSPSSPSSAVCSPLPPPDPSISPVRPKPRSSSKNHSASDGGSLIRGLWPSYAKKSSTLADHLGNDRLIDFIERSKLAPLAQNLNRQRSCSEFAQSAKESFKENRPIGGSMRFTGKLHFSGKSAPSSQTPGRFSVDESALDQRPLRRRSDTFSDLPGSESERSDISLHSAMSGSSRRSSGIEVPARFLQDPAARSRRSDSENPQNSSSSPAKVTMKRSNTVTGYGSEATKWALSPGRPAQAFSSLRPRSPTTSSSSSSKGGSGKGMGSFLSMGLDLLKGKRSSSSSSTASSSSRGGALDVEAVHSLRMLNNRALQWRFANAKAAAVTVRKVAQAETALVNAWAALSQLQSLAVQKRIQLEREKLELKVDNILSSQIKLLEAWGDMERQHQSAVSTMKDSLHSVVCRVPLIEGAKGEIQPVSIMLRHATDLTASIKAMTKDFSPMAQKSAPLLSELAEVVTIEKTLLQECFELLNMLAILELQERSLRCQLIQLKLQQKQRQQQQLQHQLA